MRHVLVRWLTVATIVMLVAACVMFAAVQS